MSGSHARRPTRSATNSRSRTPRPSHDSGPACCRDPNRQADVRVCVSRRELRDNRYSSRRSSRRGGKWQALMVLIDTSREPSFGQVDGDAVHTAGGDHDRLRAFAQLRMPECNLVRARRDCDVAERRLTTGAPSITTSATRSAAQPRSSERCRRRHRRCGARILRDPQAVSPGVVARFH